MLKYFLLVFVLLAAGNSDCRRNSPKSPKTVSTTSYNFADFVEDLEKDGAKVESAGEISQPFVSVKGTLIKLNSNDVQVFEFANAEDANNVASKVSADGSSIGNTRPGWVAPPHFHKMDKIIVLYVGENESVIKLLVSILGPQFAGK